MYKREPAQLVLRLSRPPYKRYVRHKNHLSVIEPVPFCTHHLCPTSQGWKKAQSDQNPEEQNCKMATGPHMGTGRAPSRSWSYGPHGSVGGPSGRCYFEVGG